MFLEHAGRGIDPPSPVQKASSCLFGLTEGLLPVLGYVLTTLERAF